MNIQIGTRDASFTFFLNSIFFEGDFQAMTRNLAFVLILELIEPGFKSTDLVSEVDKLLTSTSSQCLEIDLQLRALSLREHDGFNQGFEVPFQFVLY